MTFPPLIPVSVSDSRSPPGARAVQAAATLALLVALPVAWAAVHHGATGAALFAAPPARTAVRGPVPVAYSGAETPRNVVIPSLPLNSARDTPPSGLPAPASAPQPAGLPGFVGLAFGAAVASLMAVARRFGGRPRGADSALLAGSASAVLEAPAPPKVDVPRPSGGVQGIVTPEEGVDLPFTLTDLRAAIPKECFEKSLGWSLFYFARDWGMVALLYYFQPAIFGLGILGKVVWWNAVGFLGWCLFVVGHDCGHGTFSEYRWINQLLGHVCHAPLLVPFNGWRISHRAHHQFHNDVDRDHSWRPSVAKSVSKLPRALQGLRFSPLILFVYPIYLISTSHEDGFSGCHFWPWNSLFKEEERGGIAASALSVFAWLGLVFAATAQFGFWTVFQLYWIPYLLFVCWLDLVTLMQHTDSNALFFRGNAWSFLRGAMSTVDRTYRHLIDPFNIGYGRIIDHLHHNISDGHFAHHLFFTQIPHYQLIKATEALKPVLGKHYRFDGTPIPEAFFNTMDSCWFVDDVQDGVVTYKGRTEYREWERQQQRRGDMA